MNKQQTKGESPQIVWPSNIIGAGRVCEILGVTRGTVSRRVKSGHLPILAQLDGPNGALVFDAETIKALAPEAAA